MDGIYVAHSWLVPQPPSECGVDPGEHLVVGRHSRVRANF